MKFSIFLFFALSGLFITMTACNSKKDDAAATTATESVPDGAVVSPDAAAARMTSGTTTTEPHYKCPQNCVGGSGSAKGPCPVCGTEMAHNQAFHMQSGAPGSTPESSIKVDPINSTGANTVAGQPSQTMPVEPAQNAKGIWHFTCPKGCEGGAGAKGACPKCGTELAHNQMYHIQ